MGYKWEKLKYLKVKRSSKYAHIWFYRLVKDNKIYFSILNTIEKYGGKEKSTKKHKKKWLMRIEEYEDFKKELIAKQKGTYVPPPTPSYVYAVKVVDKDIVKIGYSTDPERRLKSIQTACPYELELLNKHFTEQGQYTEKQIHKALDCYQMNGEWFELPKSIIRNIEKDMGAWINATLTFENSMLSKEMYAEFLRHVNPRKRLLLRYTKM